MGSIAHTESLNLYYALMIIKLKKSIFLGNQQKGLLFHVNRLANI